MALDFKKFWKLSTEERWEYPTQVYMEMRREAACYHEAGHAVAACHYGYTIKSVTATDEIQGALYRCPFIRTFADYWREACITVSGKFAEDIAVNDEVEPHPWEKFLSEAEDGREEVEAGDVEARTDDVDMLFALEGMSGTDYGKGSLEDLYDQVVEGTRDMVREDWSAIEAVAKALESTGHLDGPEVEEIIEGCRE